MKNKRKINFFALLFLLTIILYISQGILFEGTWFTTLSGVYLLSFNIFAMIKVLGKSSDKVLFTLLIFMIGWMAVLWVISPKSYHSSGEAVSTLYMVQYSIIVFSSVFSFYYISEKQLIENFQLKTFIILLAMVYVYNILHFDVAADSAGDFDFSTVNNKSYSVAALFPLLSLFWNKKWIMISLMTAALFLVAFCLKRGAMLIAMSCYVLAFIFMFKENRLNRKYRRLLFLLILLIICGVVYVFYNIYHSDDLIQARIDLTLEGGSSGRDYIYAKIWHAWQNSGFISRVVGHGPISTLSVSSNYAHNDWLEILFDFGLIGLLFYIGIIYYVTVYSFKRRSLSLQHKMGLLMSLSYIILRSSFSMCIYELDSLLAFGYIGYIMGDNYLNRKKLVMASLNKNEVK